MLNQFRKLSLVYQLASFVLITVLVVFSSLTYFVTKAVDKEFIQAAETDLIQQMDQIAGNIDFFYDTLQLQTDQLADVFIEMFPGSMEIDASESKSVGSFKVPALSNENQLVTQNFEKPDRFTKMTGGTATVFMRVEDDFLRVSTSLRKSDGTRAFGTMLGKAHPGYKKLINGESYLGPAYLFGKNYMTKYVPFKNSSGKVIGIFYIGFNFTDGLAVLKNKISKLVIGDTGYTYIVNLKKGKNYGELIYHPSKEGENLAEIVENGAELIKQFEARKNGVAHYSFNQNGQGVKDKTIAFAHTERWNWTIVGGTTTEEFTKNSTSLQIQMIIISAVSALLISGLIFFALRRSLKPIDTICGYMSAVGQGDLTVQVETDMGQSKDTRNEIQLLGLSVKKTIGGLRKVTQQLKETSTDMGARLLAVGKDVDRLSQNVNNQQKETEMVASAVDQMTSSSQGVSSSAAEAAEQTLRASEEAESGDQLVQNVVDSIKSISTEVTELSSSIEQVEQNSNLIGSVTDVIQNIAEQTNLLALNAAIEAARAGDAGRGFAVVADEVRNLAHQTADSTTEIRGMIENLQNNTRNAVQRMEGSNAKVHESVNMTIEAGKALTQITQAVNRIAGSSGQIATSAGEQTKVTQDISNSIANISSVAIETSSFSNDMRSAINDLEDSGKELQRVIELFKY